MKRCPECRRDYTDGSLNFCLDDGARLLDGPAMEPRALAGGPSGDFEPSTAIVSEAGTAIFPASEAPRHDVENSVAVMPFKNISADAENEYFCEGLAEELLNGLAKIGGLKVAARMSAFSFKERNADIGEIGRKLGVANVLEGSVRKSGERLRIAVQLLNASDGYHVWSETYDREMRDIFDVQDEITMSVVDALKMKLLGDAGASVARRETPDTEAYKAYLKGRYLRYAKNDHGGAALAYEEAVRIDPSHAPSWLGIAETFVLRAHYALIDPLEACARAMAALETARKLQGESAEALYIAGFAAFIEHDWPACLKAYRRSLGLEPDNPRALGTFGVINCVLGNLDAGLSIFERARAVDPLAAYPYAMTGIGLAASRRPAESISFFEQALAFDKNQALALWGYSVATCALGDFEKSIAAAERSVAVTHRADFFVALLGWALAAAGRTGEARSILNELADRPKGSPQVAFEACLLGALGQIDAGLESLTRVVDEYAPLACYAGLPCFDTLRGDPRFAELVRRMTLPHLTV